MFLSGKRGLPNLEPYSLDPIERLMDGGDRSITIIALDTEPITHSHTVTTRSAWTFPFLAPNKEQVEFCANNENLILDLEMPSEIYSLRVIGGSTDPVVGGG